MDSWYHNTQQDSVKKWINEHKANIENNNITEQFQIHSRWCDLAGITGTPTIFINGVKLPTVFKIKDLKRMASLLNITSEATITN
jgi:protein-disulfide isomerase